MVEMTCEEHDRQSASTQFVTHTVGRMLGAMNLETTSINTKGFEALLQLVEQTNTDSFDLYYGLFLYNQNAVEEVDRMEEVSGGAAYARTIRQYGARGTFEGAKADAHA